jgi:copper homeostasis protein
LIFREFRMKTLQFEVCVETLEAARAAEGGGANRIELCADLAVGGVTPASDLITATVAAVAIPVHVLIRPRDGDFVYSEAEFELMKSQINEAKRAGAAGIAVGVLLPDLRVDVARSRELVELARPMRTTFHRAFDETPNLAAALEDVIATGADCLLTSGGEANVLAGSESIARVCRLANDRLEVMAGGGLRLENLAEVVRKTGVAFLHASLNRKNSEGFVSLQHGSVPQPQSALLEEDVREALRLFQQERGDCEVPVPAAGEAIGQHRTARQPLMPE